jgi:hypothetical protein
VKVISVPQTLEERTFDALVQALTDAGPGRVLFDARRVRWVDPFGMVGLLAAGEVAGKGGERPALQLPESAEVLSYLSRMAFLDHADGIFELHGGGRRGRSGGSSDVLLEITPIRSYDDIHIVVDRVNEHAISILTHQLHYPHREAFQFGAVLSEVCQNILEHAQAAGWVAAQTYSRTPRIERRVVKIGVVDLGIGFKGSLAASLAARHGERWSDVVALEAAFIHGLTRFHDPGRGQGLKQIRKQVGRWGGKVSIRSGTARIADVPEWDDVPPLQEKLPFFPGAQIEIVLPARIGEEAADRSAVTRGRTPGRAA